ncbi:MAG: alpha/beta fold hydrolase [Deltaproteobacteria bacterium]|jgi:pimeloyl-ACP methyl ester carboxylesterase|nr:alpha/beta fold hydrolase [Deltaproteobacteria bacterium]
MNIIKLFLALFLLVLVPLRVSAAENTQNSPLAIQEQGSFAVGGVVIQNPGQFNPLTPGDPTGQSYHGDHAYVFYQKPVTARKYPLVFLHGAGQFSKTWETTPDGREGFQNIFLRRGFSVYLLDQPRRGDAGRSSQPATIAPTPDEQMWFTQFRVGVWPDYFPGIQFPKDEATLNQYFRQMTPNTGEFDLEVISKAIAALYAQIGQGILVTHSQGGGPGWLTAIKSQNVRAIVAYEPGSNFTFPENEVPPPIENKYATLRAMGVPLADFQKLTKIPIIIYYGDNIPADPSDIPAQDYWRACLEMATRFAETINKNGGDATVVHLPKAGIYGNTHFPFSDLNNIQIADHLSAWLKEKQLD